MHSSHNLFIVIDLGNSATTYGVYSGVKLKSSGYLQNNNIPKLIGYLHKSGALIRSRSVLISSVVPDLTFKLTKSISRFISKNRIHRVESILKGKVLMRYSRKTLGSDRLVNIYGAVRQYKLPILIADFGTAITFDYISKKGIFEGGLIVPGIKLSADALAEKTALLPKLKEIKSVHKLVGRNTKDAMYSGLLNGFGALSDGLIERFRKQYDSKLKVLATGGFAMKIAPYVKRFDYIDPLHTIRSLALIYRNEIKNQKD